MSGNVTIRKSLAKRTLGGLETKPVYFRMKTLMGILAVLVLAIICDAICFFGRTRTDLRFVSNQGQMTQLISTLTFEYPSEIATKSKQDAKADQVFPSYKIDSEIEKLANNSFTIFIEKLNEIQAQLKSPDAEVVEDMDNKAIMWARMLRKTSTVDIHPNDLLVILEHTTADNFKKLFSLALHSYKNIMDDGIYDASDDNFKNLVNINLVENKAIIRTEQFAKKEFRNSIYSQGFTDNLSSVFFRIISQKITPNIVYDAETTKKQKEEIRKTIAPVVIKIREGEIIADPSSEITPFIKEKIAAHRKFAAAKNLDSAFTFGSLTDFIISVFLISAAALFIVVSKNPKTKKKSTIVSFVLLLLLNLILLRLVIDLADARSGIKNLSYLQIIAYAIPILISPMLQVLLVSAYTGFVMSFLISSFATLMLGQPTEYFILIFVSSLVAIYYCEKSQTRYRVICGGFFYGAILALGCILTGIISTGDTPILLAQSFGAMFAGLVTSFIVLAVMPLFERLFNLCSDITLFEFTDFNKPLLSKLQMSASGTLHHSIMVARLAEDAARKVKANYLLCHVAALYHDVGKLSKPEFFSENQYNALNPHDEQTPSMSALIIKNHITYGIELGKLAKLPSIVLNAIAEHHGTSMINYFYHKAQKAVENSKEKDLQNALRAAGIDESTYRYDGPKPRTTEGAILMLADSCEAASRSLKKITQHAIEELVSQIFRGKMADGQLDDAPITVHQLSLIRESFLFTMLNMYHSRVEYPKEK